MPLNTPTVHYALDEASGNAIDSLGANNLTDNASVGAAAGKVAGARQFNSASSRYFSLASNATIQAGDIDFTWAGWAYLDSKTTFRLIISKYKAGSSSGFDAEYIIYYDSSADRFLFGVGNGVATVATVLANNLGSPSTATWYYLVCWHDSVGNTVNIQVSDGAVNSAAAAAGGHTNTGQFDLGARGLGGLPYDGRLDEWSYWKYIPDTTERTWLYNAGAGRTYAEIAAYGAAAGSGARYANLNSPVLQLSGG